MPGVSSRFFPTEGRRAHQFPPFSPCRPLLQSRATSRGESAAGVGEELWDEKVIGTSREEGEEINGPLVRSTYPLADFLPF